MPNGSRQLIRRKIEQLPSIPGDRFRHSTRFDIPRSSETCDRVSYPRRLVALPAKRHRRKVRRIRFCKNAIVRHEAQQVVVSPLAEGHDPTERNVPASFDCARRKVMGPGVTVKNAPDTRLRRLGNHGSGVCLRISGVYDHRQSHLAGKSQLLRKCASLLDPGRIVVMVVETALADRNRSVCCDRPDGIDVTRRVEPDRIMRVNACGIPYKARIGDRDIPRRTSGAENISGAAA